MNDTKEWEVTLTTFESNEFIWGRTIAQNYKVNSNSYFVDNIPLQNKRSLVDNKTGGFDTTKINTLYNNKAQNVIDTIVKMYKVLQVEGKSTFKYLKEYTKIELRKSVLRSINYHLSGETFIENRVGGSIATNSLTVSDNISSYRNVSEMLGSEGFTSLKNSNIDKYEIDSYGTGILYKGKYYEVVHKEWEENVDEVWIDMTSDTEISKMSKTKGNLTGSGPIGKGDLKVLGSFLDGNKDKNYELEYVGKDPNYSHLIGKDLITPDTEYNNIKWETKQEIVSSKGVLTDKKIVLVPKGQTVTPVTTDIDLTKLEQAQTEIGKVV